ncbi:hypothetical protein B0H14DRAFT_2577858 [Mycena olivaceomarginata]|nr:hypothetical protein B0H14DRAFT_2577858 [Mycena olivaceomarginata]
MRNDEETLEDGYDTNRKLTPTIGVDLYWNRERREIGICLGIHQQRIRAKTRNSQKKKASKIHAQPTLPPNFRCDGSSRMGDPGPALTICTRCCQSSAKPASLLTSQSLWNVSGRSSTRPGSPCIRSSRSWGLFRDGPGAEPLTPEQLKSIASAYLDALEEGQHHLARCPQTVRSLQDTKAKKKTRPLRAVEVYQKLYRDKIRSEVMQRGYGELNEEAEADRVALARDPDAEPSVLTPEEEQEVEEQAMARVCANRAARMSLLRTTAMEVFAAEPEEVRAEVLSQMEKMNKERGSGVNDDADTETRTPEEYQHHRPVTRGDVEVHRSRRGGGWVDGLLHGGRTDAQSFCFGTTPNGANFAASHSNFGEVKAGVRPISSNTLSHTTSVTRGQLSQRQRRTAIVPSGLIPFDSDAEGGSDEEGQKASSSATPAAPPSTAKPKCRFDQTIQDIVTNLSGIDDTLPAATWTVGAGLTNGWDGIVPPAEDSEAVSPWNGLSLPSSQIEEDFVPPRPFSRPMHLGAAFVVDRDVGGSPGRAPIGTQELSPSSSAPDAGSVPAPAACSATSRMTSVTGASATVATPASSGITASATFTMLAATPEATTTTTRTPRSTAALAVWNAPPASPQAPQFPESCPQANAPRGHPQAPVKKAAAKSKKAPAKKKAGGRSRGRPRKNASAEEEEEQGQPLPSPPPSLPGTPGVIAPLTGAAAAAESACIRREEGQPSSRQERAAASLQGSGEEGCRGGGGEGAPPQFAGRR